MERIFLETKVLWSQIDANGHLRHSAYADFAAQARVEMLESLGLTMAVMQLEAIGPILFREEIIYKREIRPGERVKVTCNLSKCRADGSRWSFVQGIYRWDGTLSAIVTVDGAWIDMQKRRLTVPPSHFCLRLLEEIPRTENFILESATSEPT